MPTTRILLSLLSDMYGAIDKSQVKLVALLDISAAFDTVNHDILCHVYHSLRCRCYGLYDNRDRTFAQ